MNQKNSVHGTSECLVDTKEHGMPLLSFIAQRMNISRKKAKALLDQRAVEVNGRPVWMAKHVVRKGQQVTILPTTAARGRGTAVSVLFEGPDYLIVDKPAGRCSNEAHSVETDLREQRKEPALVAAHRLDKDTTGCLLFARSPAALKAVIDLFRAKQVTKTYHAIVHGRLEQEERTVRDPLEGKSAVTHCKTLDTRNQASHLLVRIQTGRTHQIRRHLADLGSPIVGDRHYAVKRKRGHQRDVRPGRQMLHASDIAFKHPVSGQSIRAKAPLPGDFRHCLKQFGLT